MVFLTLAIILCLAGNATSQNLSEDGLPTQEQSIRKHRIGFHANPHPYALQEIAHAYYLGVWALRYGYLVHNRITVGPEISGYYYRNHYADITNTYLNVGAFIRYDFLKYKKIGLSAEFSPYLELDRVKQNPVYNPNLPLQKENRFSFFLAPVMSYGKPNGLFSFDVMWKFSYLPMYANYKSVPSIRFNFHF
jgi:hypothetical protein